MIPKNLPNAWPPGPTDAENATVHLTSVQWLGDRGMGVCCGSRHYDCLCTDVYWFYGLKIIDRRSAVKCCVFGL